MPHQRSYRFTSESVTEGHPDKMADQISDAVLDAILKKDPNGRVACESILTTGMCLVAGEITTKTYVDIPKVVRETIRDIGYDDPLSGFEWQTVAVVTSIDEQSPDISMGVDDTDDREQGAGDQGIMFGYASNETPELMPMPITFAHKLTSKLAEVRKKGTIDYLRPDGKSQVTIEYKEGQPKRIEAVVIAAHHCPDIPRDKLKGDIIDKVIKPVLPEEMIDENTKIFINETGLFVIGGPRADTGLTGRKIIVDTYGGVGSHGGGCFSGKDPSKVDRSGSYAARHIAKNVVAAGLADKCEIQVAYAIGVARPVSILVDCKDTNKIPEVKIEKLVTDVFDLRPRAIISRLDLLRPIYKKTAAYGHFGREDPDFTWEKKDLASILKDKAGV